MIVKGLKPIQTEYNGFLFRSKLEAQWAYFFDLAGIRYIYEPEGFKLPTGECYLPDFYLPDIGHRAHGLAIEVKGGIEDPAIKAEALRKAILYSRIAEASNNEYGLPDPELMNPIIIIGAIPKSHEELFKQPEELWNAGTVDGDSGYRVIFYKNEDGSIGLYGADNVGDTNGFNFFDEFYLKARQARFDHGQTPTVPNSSAIRYR